MEESEVTINQYKSGGDSQLKEHKRELASAVRGPVVLTHHLKKLLASLGDEVNLRDQVENEPTAGADMKSPGANDPGGMEMRSPEADNPNVDYPEFDELDADTPGADDYHTWKSHWLLLNVVT